MKLYELCSAIIIQGNIAVKVFNEEVYEIEARYFRNQDNFDTNIPAIADLEDLEVIYMYPMDLYDRKPWLVIEVREYHEV